MAFPSGPCCPLYLLRIDVYGEEKPCLPRKRMPLPSLTRLSIDKQPLSVMGQLSETYKKKKIPSDGSGGILKGKALAQLSYFPKSKKSLPINREGFLKERRRHTLPQNCSTICAGGLNFSVRDGKR